MLSDAETVTGGTTVSEGETTASDGGATDSAVGSDHAPGDGSRLVVNIGSLGFASFIFFFISRFAAFCARAVWRCRCRICF